MKPIKDYEGYFITERGEVYSNYTGKLKPMFLSTSRGYKTVVLRQRGIRKNVKVHRLVAEAYIPNPHNLPQVDHKDEDKSNNNVTNLQWITGANNTIKSCAKHYIVEVVATGELIEVYNMRKWCKDNNTFPASMLRTRRGEQSAHKGYKLH